MRPQRIEVHEEGLVLVRVSSTVDQFDRIRGFNVGSIFARGRHLRLRKSVSVGDPKGFKIAGAVGRIEVIPTFGNDEHIVGVQELSDLDRVISGVLHPCAQIVLGVTSFDVSPHTTGEAEGVREIGFVDFDPAMVSVLRSQQAGSRGPAKRRGSVGIGERDASLSKLVQVRESIRQVLFRKQFLVRVIEIDQNDVWLLSAGEASAKADCHQPYGSDREKILWGEFHFFVVEYAVFQRSNSAVRGIYDWQCSTVHLSEIW